MAGQPSKASPPEPEAPSGQATLNPNSGKPRAAPPPEVVHLTPNTEGRIYTLHSPYVPGTTDRMKVLGDKVAAVLKKPKGQVTREEVLNLFDDISKVGADGEPLSVRERMNVYSLVMSVAERGNTDGVLTQAEVMQNKQFLAAAVVSMAFSGGGSGARSLARPAGGPVLPRTTSRGSGAFVLPREFKISEKILRKIPKDWGEGAPNKKGVGTRWQDPNNPGNGVRIDAGNPENSQVIQQVDHAVVRVDGEVIGRDGLPIPGGIKDSPDLAHIPLNEYENWTTWSSPK